MDIHPPAGAVHSFRDYCIHLSMVVVGILIALTLEGALERQHAHQLAERAARDMLAEIHSNQAQVEQSLASLERAKAQAQKLLEAQANAIEAQRHHASPSPEGPSESGSVSFPVLSSAAWDSALAMQAVGHIDVDSAEIFSRIYTDQREVKDFQKMFLGIALHAETYAGRMVNDTPERMLDRLGALQQLAVSLQNLINDYRELLAQYSTAQHVGAKQE